MTVLNLVFLLGGIVAFVIILARVAGVKYTPPSYLTEIESAPVKDEVSESEPSISKVELPSTEMVSDVSHYADILVSADIVTYDPDTVEGEQPAQKKALKKPRKKKA